MLKIFNLLQPFFEDMYREISVREYAKEKKSSPPTASKILKDFNKENLLLLTKKGIYLFFRANRDNVIFKGLSKLYWQSELFKETEELHNQALFRKIVLFGSLAKSENTKDSDIDLFIDIERKKLNIKDIENKLKRKVQIHFRDSLKNPHLKKNIEKGIIIR
ncbi:hypothetical protein CMO93_02540 [Candidatus Woesearchaeota archaeon]|jgi:predicted nucleotidyltransferase|nr:hypothetical protein [Candidatus Woesearchaeota archaeon]|tara:strand:- start:100 stop:585 length:486 start_codon:yes stop_codon:yes gene_type:complete